MTFSLKTHGQLVAEAVVRMRAWAVVHPACDSQGITDDEWEALARAAHDVPQPPEED